MINIAGMWTISYTESEGGCGPTGTAVKVTVQATVTQRGNSISLSDPGRELKGVLVDRMLSVSGRYREGNKTTEEHLTATVNAAGTKLIGGSIWTYGVTSSSPCGGTTTFSGKKN